MAETGTPRMQILPLTPERWAAFEALFGPRGACAGCWCMWFRLPRREFDAGKGEGNRRAMRRLVDGGAVPGLLAFVRDRPAGWCSVAPRGDFPRLARSRIAAPVDDRPVWSVVCLFVDREHRRMGVATRLLGAAGEWAAAHGATLVEGYAVEPRSPSMPDTFAYQGPVAAFRAAGYREVARPSAMRVVMRKAVGPGQG